MGGLEILHEINEYENRGFPFGMYTVTKASITPKGRGYQDLHWHEELQFTVVLSGELTIQVYNESYMLKTGEGIFINSGMLHVTKFLSEGGAYVSFNCPMKMLGFFPGSLMETAYVLPYTRDKALPAIVFKRSDDWAKAVLDQLYICRQLMLAPPKLGKEYELSILLTQIWYQMIQYLDQHKNLDQSWIKQHNRLQLFLDFIHSDYMEEIRLEDIAHVAHVSAGECGRCFRSILQVSPIEYLSSYRIQKSMALLTETEKSVTEIAYSVGFKHVSYFIQQFKQQVGMTPKKYRQP
jgi:AraC-like DNA-binding protein